MKNVRRLPKPHFVRSVYRRAIRDELLILRLWPNAREHKKKVVSELGFSPIAAEWLRESGATQADIERIRVAHQKAIKEMMPDLCRYRPSELIHANLHEAWITYADLLLKTAARLDGTLFKELKPQLSKIGFEEQILDVFQPDQKRKYFLQQTPASVATMIVARRHHRRIGSEEAVRTAQKRLYSRVRARHRVEPISNIYNKFH
jgi:hypothetical protein